MGGGVDPRPGVVIFLVSAAVEERAVSLEPVFHTCQQSTAQHDFSKDEVRIVVQVLILYCIEQQTVSSSSRNVRAHANRDRESILMHIYTV
jgi:hypothetical protein